LVPLQEKRRLEQQQEREEREMVRIARERKKEKVGCTVIFRLSNRQCMAGALQHATGHQRVQLQTTAVVSLDSKGAHTTAPTV
jgi:hypothetical protein